MQSSLIGKIEKAHRYADERAERIQISALSVDFHGDNDQHHVQLASGTWHCSCNFFSGWGFCCHTMALEKVLDGMLPREITQQSKMIDPQREPAAR